MAKNIAKLEFDFGKDFDKQLFQSVAQSMKRRQDRIRRKTRTRLKNIITFYVKTSQVMKSLKGSGGGYSLKAELGLGENEEGKDLVEQAEKKILDVMIEAVDVSVRAGRGDRSSGISEVFVKKLVDIDFIEQNLGLDAPPFTYTSVGSSHVPTKSGRKSRRRVKRTIRWGQAVMNPSTAINDQYFPDLSQQIETVNGLFYFGIVRRGGKGSRSGLAIMTPRFSFPYQMPKLLIPRTKAKNFLDEILRSRKFRADIVKAIEEIVLEELKRG